LRQKLFSDYYSYDLAIILDVGVRISGLLGMNLLIVDRALTPSDEMVKNHSLPIETVIYVIVCDKDYLFPFSSLSFNPL
jgi:hypothetical protein